MVEIYDYRPLIDKYSLDKAKSLENLEVMTTAVAKLHEAGARYKLETPFVLAGGLVRDTVFGLQFNDVDVFFPGDLDEDTITLWEAIAKEALGYEAIDSKSGVYVEVENSFAVSELYDQDLEREITQLIFRKEATAKETIDNFDYSLVKLGHLGPTPAFLKAADKLTEQKEFDSTLTHLRKRQFLVKYFMRKNPSSIRDNTRIFYRTVNLEDIFE